MSLETVICSRISSHIDAAVDSNTESVSFEESNPALDLVDAGFVDKNKTQTSWKIITITTENQFVFEVSIAFIKKENIVYISDFEFGEQYQNQGLGKAVHTAIINELEQDAVQLFEVPTNPAMESIVRNDGFESVKNEALSKWFVRN